MPVNLSLLFAFSSRSPDGKVSLMRHPHAPTQVVQGSVWGTFWSPSYSLSLLVVCLRAKWWGEPRSITTSCFTYVFNE